MNNNRVLLFLFSAVSIFSASCGFFRIADPIPISWPVDGITNITAAIPEHWIVSWLNTDGSVSKSRVLAREPAFISIPRESPIIIAASPDPSLFPAPYAVKPAGFVLAADNPRPSNLQLSWERGFPAVFLLRMAESGVFPGLININRFLESVEDRSASNPWNLDADKLAAEILEGDLWTYSFRSMEIMDVSVPLNPGLWYSEYPPDTPVISEDGSWNSKLTKGIHHFIRPSDHSVVSIYVTERGDVITFN